MKLLGLLRQICQIAISEVMISVVHVVILTLYGTSPNYYLFMEIISFGGRGKGQKVSNNILLCKCEVTNESNLRPC